MAFPSIASSTTSGESTTVSSHDVSLPAGVSSGDLLIVLFAIDANPTVTFPAGWTAIRAATVADDEGVTGHGYYRIADGSEGATIVVGTSSARQSAHIAFRIASGGFDSTTPIAASASAFNTDAAPDPPNCNPGVSADYLWIECFFADDDDETATYWSTNYTGIAQSQSNTSSTTSVMVSAAYRQLNASSENPGTMALALAEQWAAWTFAINPSTAVAGDTSSIPVAAIAVASNAVSASTTEKHRSAIPSKAVAVAALAPSATTTEKHFSALQVKAIAVASNAITATTSAADRSSIPLAEITIEAFEVSAGTTENDIAAIPVAEIALATNAVSAESTEHHVSALETAAVTLQSYAPSAVTTGEEAEESDTHDGVNYQPLYVKRVKKKIVRKRKRIIRRIPQEVRREAKAVLAAVEDNNLSILDTHLATLEIRIQEAIIEHAREALAAEKAAAQREAEAEAERQALEAYYQAQQAMLEHILFELRKKDEEDTLEAVLAIAALDDDLRFL